MKFQLKNNSYLLMLMMLLAFVGDALSAERGADRPGGGLAAAAAAGAEGVEEPIFTLPPGHDEITAALSPDGSKLATISRYVVKIWNIETHELIKEIEYGSQGVFLFRFSPNGRKLVMVEPLGTLKLWNVEDGKLIIESATAFKDVDVAFSSDSSHLATISKMDEVKIWNAENGELIKELNLKVRPIFSVTFSPDGSNLVTVEQGGTAKIWNAGNGELIQEFDFEVSSVKFSPDGSKLAMVSRDKTVSIWNVEEGELIKKLRFFSSSVPIVAFSSDKELVTAKIRNKITINIWNAENGDLIQKLDLEVLRPIISVKFSPDGRILVITSASVLVVYNVETGEVIRKLRSDGSRFVQAELSYKGSRLLTKSTDRVVQVWQIQSGRLTKPAIAKKSIKDTLEGKFLQSQITVTAALSKAIAQQIKDNYENLKKAIENNEVENKMPEDFEGLYNKALQF